MGRDERGHAREPGLVVRTGGMARAIVRGGAGMSVYALAASACAQCVPAWSPLGDGAQAGITASGIFDPDGPGPVPQRWLGAGGFPITFAGLSVNGIVQWDGWSPQPAGLGIETVYSVDEMLAVDGADWPVPTGLYVAGYVHTAGGLPVKSLARWDGALWHDVGGGVSSATGAAHPVFALSMFDADGRGPGTPSLYVGGIFEYAGGVPATSIASWNGSTWSAVGGPLTMVGANQRPDVHALQAFDEDGPGPGLPVLFVGGDFRFAGGIDVQCVARWDGQSWSGLQNLGPNGLIDALCVFDEDGPGPLKPALFVGGDFNYVGWPGGFAVNDLVRWDGANWSPVGGQIGGGVRDMAVFDDDGPGPRRQALFVTGYLGALIGGQFTSDIARWDGQEWAALGAGLTGPINEGFTLSVFDEDGAGPNPGGLYVGGYFSFAGGVPARHVARWGCPLPPRCDANCNRDFDPVTGSPALTIADFACFQARYATADPFADCNADGALTIADFGCFQAKFAAGCP